MLVCLANQRDDVMCCLSELEGVQYPEEDRMEGPRANCYQGDCVLWHEIDFQVRLRIFGQLWTFSRGGLGFQNGV